VPSQGRAASIRILSVGPQAATCKLGSKKRYPTGDAVRDLIGTDHEFSRPRNTVKYGYFTQLYLFWYIRL
jgi:hypothetical protein